MKNPNDEIRMTNQIPRTKVTRKTYDLKERTEKFGLQVIRLAKKIPESSVTRSVISQLVRSGTSVGANYCEADDASTKKDFFYRIGISRKEAKETKYWLRMVIEAVPDLQDQAEPLMKEARELNFIFSAILNHSRKKTEEFAIHEE